MPSSALLSRLRVRAADLGFDFCSAAPPAVSQDDRSAYESWRASGAAAGLAYMNANVDKRVNPRALVPWATCVLSLGVSYFQGSFPEKPGAGFGRVARYAWGADYHDIIRERLRALIDALPEVAGRSVRAELAVDTKPVLERALARSAGEGFVGKNTVFIAPQAGERRGFHVGSFLFLCELFVDLDVPLEPARSLSGCGACTRCLTSCPTGAFEGAYRLNAGRCISYLTIENKGPIPTEMRTALGDWLFGCDVCQDVCPFNARAKATRWPEFASDRGAGPWLSVAEILAIDDGAAFRRRFGTSPLSRAKREGLLRNACVVAGNSSDESLREPLAARLGDASALVRGHALAALGRLAPALARRRADALRNDPDPFVQTEANGVLRGGMPS